MSKTELHMVAEEHPDMSTEMKQLVELILQPSFLSSAIGNLTLDQAKTAALKIANSANWAIARVVLIADEQFVPQLGTMLQTVRTFQQNAKVIRAALKARGVVGITAI